VAADKRSYSVLKEPVRLLVACYWFLVKNSNRDRRDETYSLSTLGANLPILVEIHPPTTRGFLMQVSALQEEKIFCIKIIFVQNTMRVSFDVDKSRQL
jgi:hypothetical protein